MGEDRRSLAGAWHKLRPDACGERKIFASGALTGPGSRAPPEGRGRPGHCSIQARLEGVHATKRLGELVEALTHAVTLDMEHEEESLFGTPAQPLASEEGARVAFARA